MNFIISVEIICCTPYFTANLFILEQGFINKMLVKGSLEYVAIINPKRRSKYYFNKNSSCKINQ